MINKFNALLSLLVRSLSSFPWACNHRGKVICAPNLQIIVRLIFLAKFLRKRVRFKLKLRDKKKTTFDWRLNFVSFVLKMYDLRRCIIKFVTWYSKMLFKKYWFFSYSTQNFILSFIFQSYFILLSLVYNRRFLPEKGRTDDVFVKMLSLVLRGKPTEDFITTFHWIILFWRFISNNKRHFHKPFNWRAQSCLLFLT